MADRALDLAWTHSQVTLRQLNATEAEAQLYAPAGQRDHLCRPGPPRHSRRVARVTGAGKAASGAYGISGDTPLVLLRITDSEKIADRAAADPGALLLAHEGARRRTRDRERRRLGLPPVAARRNHQSDLLRHGAQMLDKPGGIFVRRLEQIPSDDRVLLAVRRSHRPRRRERHRCASIWSNAACWSRWSRR